MARRRSYSDGDFRGDFFDGAGTDMMRTRYACKVTELERQAQTQLHQIEELQKNSRQASRQLQMVQGEKRRLQAHCGILEEQRVETEEQMRDMQAYETSRALRNHTPRYAADINATTTPRNFLLTPRPVGKKTPVKLMEHEETIIVEKSMTPALPAPTAPPAPPIQVVVPVSPTHDTDTESDICLGTLYPTSNLSLTSVPYEAMSKELCDGRDAFGDFLNGASPRTTTTSVSATSPPGNRASMLSPAGAARIMRGSGGVATEGRLSTLSDISLASPRLMSPPSASSPPKGAAVPALQIPRHAGPATASTQAACTDPPPPQGISVECSTSPAPSEASTTPPRSPEARPVLEPSAVSSVMHAEEVVLQGGSAEVLARDVAPSPLLHAASVFGQQRLHPEGYEGVVSVASVAVAAAAAAAGVEGEEEVVEPEAPPAVELHASQMMHSRHAEGFNLESWVSIRLSMAQDPVEGAGAVPTGDVVKCLTGTEEVTPTHEDFKRQLEETAASEPGSPVSPGGRHSTERSLSALLRCVQADLVEAKACQPLHGGGRDVRSRRELELLHRNVNNALERLSGKAHELFVDISARDFQQLRTLEGILHTTLHYLSQDNADETQEQAHYRAALVRQQKALIRQKWYILVNQPLRVFYIHLTKCLRAVLLLLRVLRYRPLDPAVHHLCDGPMRFLDYMMQLMPNSERLFMCRQSVAQLSGPRRYFSDYCLADIDAMVDAVAVTLCKKHEQQLGMLTSDILGDRCGCTDAADYLVGTILESMRHGKVNAEFPQADQLVAWCAGRTLVLGDSRERQRRVLSVSDPLDAQLEGAASAGVSLPDGGIVATAPPSDHLRWTAEGVFRFCGVRTPSGTCFGYSYTGEETGFEHYGFASDTEEAAKDFGMQHVTSLLWGAQPPDVWKDDTEYLGLNPVLLTFASPVTYTLLSCQDSYPLCQGLLVAAVEPKELPKESDRCTSKQRSKTLGWNSRSQTNLDAETPSPRKKRSFFSKR